MKKIIVFLTCILAVVTLTGCNMNNTPTKRVEQFLNKYTSNDDSVLDQLKEMINNDSLMNDDQKEEYSDIMKKQYKDMTYEIKDETIDGDNATVTAEIEVYDYYKANKESEDYFNNNQSEFMDSTDSTAENAAESVINNAKYIAYRLEQLGKAKDRVKYTIDFTLTKVDDKWKLNDIDDATRQKLHGLYEH